MKFQPFIAIPLSLLAAACSSSKFNSLMEARNAASEWEDQGERITISWTERKRNTEYNTVALTDEEYKRETKRNSEAAFEYGTDLLAKRDAWTKKMISSMRVSEGFLDHPDLKNTREWRQTRYYGRIYALYPCKETSQIMCVTREKIAGRFPPKTRQVSKMVWEEVEKGLNFAQRDCTLEHKTNQFVCWHLPSKIELSSKNKKEAEQIKASIEGKKQYKYFRY